MEEIVIENKESRANCITCVSISSNNTKIHVLFFSCASKQTLNDVQNVRFHSWKIYTNEGKSSNKYVR